MQTTEHDRVSDYLKGNFAPIDDEIDVGRLEVEGAIPSALSGQFLRNGPNPMFDPLGSYHWFDGDGMLHGVTIRNGKASYRNRWIASKGLAAERRAGRALYGGMSNFAPPDPALVGDEFMKNAANTNVVRHAGRIMCLWEAGLPTVVTPELETTGTFDYRGKLQGAMTAHPHIDPRTGEMFFFGYVPTLQYHRVSAAGELLQSVPVSLPKAVMMHDFTITDRHAIFFDAPAVMDFGAMMNGEPMVQWRPDNGTRIGVMARDGDGSDLRWFEIPNGYVVHFLNSWEDGDRIVIDACRFDQMDFGAANADVPDATSYLSRFTVDLTRGQATWERLGDLPVEFPRVNAAVEGRRHRYGYVASFASGPPKGPRFDSVTKYDLAHGASAKTHVFGPGQVTGEAVFAPDPASTGEDDGWLLSLVHDEHRTKTDLVILDAHDMTETARIHMPRRVPYGFHANWLPDLG